MTPKPSVVNLIIETLGLQTPRGRIIFFITITIGVFLAPYSWLEHLSIWQYLHIPSPSIGLTRAYWLLLHLDPVEAWRRNPLIYLIVAIGAPILIRDCLKLWYNYRATRTRSSAD